MTIIKAVDVKVVDMEIVAINKIKGLATITITDFGTLAGIKVIEGELNTYCVPPNQCYTQNGIRTWKNVVTFDRALWTIIQEKVLTSYEEANAEKIDRQFNK